MIGKTISHYKILEKIGVGGMAEVYKAEDTRLKRIVALKFPSAQSLENEEEKRRFIHEAQAAAALDHPNICTLYDIHEDEEHTFISMAYVDGKTVEEKTAYGPLSHDEALDIAIQVAGGLKEAHEHGIVHRDIKSANIMVTEKGQAKITDFGLAKLLGRTRVTERGKVMGTVDYMSPEQAQGEDADHRTDIWSLGVVMYKMLTAMPPFDEMSDAEIMHRIVYGEPEPIHTYTENVPEKTCRVIMKMLQKDPADRYENMEDLLKDLKNIESDISVSSSSPQKKPSIAVLPFANISGDKEQEYFCDGLTEELINGLAQLGGLRVVARTSAFFFKDKNMKIRDIGRELGVANILEGSVRKSGSRLRITGQLVNVADGYHLWSERYDREIEDIFAIQDEITETIIDKLKPKLLGEEKQSLARRQIVDLEAYELYLKGRYFTMKWTKEGLYKAIEYFNRALEKSPDYALAYSGLADTYATLPFFAATKSREAFSKAETYAQKALEIDNELAEAIVSLAIVKMHNYWDWEGAEKEFKRAIDINPDYAEAHMVYAANLQYRGRHEEAIEKMKHARRLDPLSPVMNQQLGRIFYYARQYDNAIEVFKKTIEMDPQFPLLHGNLGGAYWQKDMHQEAIAEFRKELEVPEGLKFTAEVSLAGALALTGNMDEAQERFRSLQERAESEYNSPMFLAGLHFALGETDKAFALLERAYEEKDVWLCLLKTEPIFESFGIHSDPRFVELLKKMGLDK